LSQQLAAVLATEYRDSESGTTILCDSKSSWVSIHSNLFFPEPL
jgi:hypothetical protein